VAGALIRAEGHATPRTMPVSTGTAETITGLRVATRVILRRRREASPTATALDAVAVGGWRDHR